MIIKDREYEVCPECGCRQLVSDYVYGCDGCGKEILLGKHDEYLSTTVFQQPSFEDNVEDFHFCCWLCFFRKLRELRTTNFIKMPFLTFDSEQEGLRVDDFWMAVKEIALEF